MNLRDFEIEFSETFGNNPPGEFPVKVVTPDGDILDVISVKLSHQNGGEIRIIAVDPYADEDDE